MRKATFIDIVLYPTKLSLIERLADTSFAEIKL